MKPRLQTSLGQQLVLTPQLRQALHMLQLSSLELEAEITQALESNPLLDWDEGQGEGGETEAAAEAPAESAVEVEDTRSDNDGDGDDRWENGLDETWGSGSGGSFDDDGGGDPLDRYSNTESLRDHLNWQLQLSRFSPRDLRIGEALIDAIDDDGYLRETLAAIVESMAPEMDATVPEVANVLYRIQRFDPLGVGARDLRECLGIQLGALDEDTPGLDAAVEIVAGPLERLPKLGVDGLAAELKLPIDEIETGLALVRSLDPKPGARLGGLGADTYISPDCVVWRQNGLWKVALAGQHQRPTIHRGYQAMIQHASGNDATYLRGCLQEARWLLKNLEARGDTLLKVMRCLIRQQAGFLEFGEQALRPLTLREVANEVGLAESTISRAVSRKYVLTPRGTLPLRSFFASGINTDGGGEASSTAIQSMIKRLIDAENPRKPLSDARLADNLKSAGVPVARRTVAKYREAMNIPSSHERVRMG